MKVLTSAIIALFFISGHSYAQQVDSLVSIYRSKITTKDLKEHLTVLTSKELNGRETGTAGNNLAADYLQRKFMEMGIPPLSGGRYFQIFPLINQKQDGIGLTIDGKELKLMEDFYPVRGVYKNGLVEGKLAYINWEDNKNGEEPSYKGVIPVFYRSEESSSGKLNQELEQAKKEGVTAAIVINENYETSVKNAKKSLSHEIIKLAEEGVYNEMITLIINEEVAEKILGTKLKKYQKKMSKSGQSSMLLEKEGKVLIDRNNEIVSSQNVLGYIEGDELKDELVIITAHYDHLGEKDGEIYYGADDDGSGTAALLELAQSFMLAKKDGVRFKRSILFMPVSGEEKGLLGSKYYTQNPVFPLKSTITNLNIDMIGRNDSKHETGSEYIYLIGSDKISKELHDLSEVTNDSCCKLMLDYTFNSDKDPNRYYYRSDHYNFAKNNIPVIFYFSGVHEDYHKPTDTMDKIDFELLSKRAKLVFSTAWALVMLEKRPAISTESP